MHMRPTRPPLLVPCALTPLLLILTWVPVNSGCSLAVTVTAADADSFRDKVPPEYPSSHEDYEEVFAIVITLTRDGGLSTS